jgi:DNA-binding transcriptional MerR regulator
MEKSPEAFRTISEVADLLDTPAHVLRFWESRFPQIRPVKRAGGRRYYRPGDVALLAGIRHLLHDQGMTIRGVQKILRDHGVRHVSGLAPGQDAAGTPAFAGAATDAGADIAPDWTGTDLPEDDDGRIIPWPGKPAPADPAGARPDPVAQALATAGPPTAGSAALSDGADPPSPDPVAGASDPAPGPVPDSAPTPGRTPLPADPPGPQALQGELFADLPDLRPPAPQPIEIGPAQADGPADPAPEPGFADPAQADIRPLIHRVRRLPPGGLSLAGLAPLQARLAALRDRMHAPPRF